MALHTSLASGEKLVREVCYDRALSGQLLCRFRKGCHVEHVTWAFVLTCEVLQVSVP